jgi:UDP-N-acetylmuramate dehydrogenase
MNTTLIKGIIGDKNYYESIPLSAHTTFKTGGNADFVFTPPGEKALAGLIAELRGCCVPYFIMGRGSNVLASDLGFRGAVIKVTGGNIDVDGCTIYSDAGVPLKSVAAAAAQNGLTGLEFAAGIPGTLGGGISMNAGAYGGELSDRITDVQVLDKHGNVLALPNSRMDFSYRHSIIQDKGYIVTGATLELEKGDKNEIRGRMDDFAAMRREKQPLEYPSAGSTFKRPPAIMPARS